MDYKLCYCHLILLSIPFIQEAETLPFLPPFHQPLFLPNLKEEHHLSNPVQTNAAFFNFRDWQMSRLTLGVAVAVSATIGT